jgi:hypothetical protein
VNLHLPALPAGVVLQPSSYRLEGIVDHDVDVLVLWICFKVLLPFFFVAASDGAVQTRLVPHDDLTPWHAQLNADVKLFSQRVMAVRDLDDHTATCDAPVKSIEFFVLDAIRTFMLAGSTSATRIKPRSENNSS